MRFIRASVDETDESLLSSSPVLETLSESSDSSKIVALSMLSMSMSSPPLVTEALLSIKPGLSATGLLLPATSWVRN